ncbi:MAG TPA: hypothetical protein VFV67_24760 [Actinophytocola sp.]|uniref:hypothetical protein n=1 Tax=Actinophytocola sp. TaxID=1872138 RepID=UPI002DB5A913|nr:hypothetical protein [Actinophytocola sp.]HEU5473870.1 hypothetical protein [Actinophytocola sp.]
MATREVLLLLSGGIAAQEFSDRASEGFRIISVFPPSMVVAEVDDLEELQRDPGVRFIVEDSVPEEVLDELTESEQLFLQGWLLKRTAPEKKRAGDRLPWDAPGFVPPDPPADST